MPRGGLPPVFRLHTPPAHQLPGAPPATNRVDMLSPGHQSKGRRSKGIPSSKEVWVPGADLELGSFTGDVVGGENLLFLME